MSTDDDQRYATSAGAEEVVAAKDSQDAPVTLADSDALARLTDPALAARRDRITAQVKIRSRVNWVLASELMRQGGQRAGDVIAHGQERFHRMARDSSVAGAKKIATAVSERVRALGKPRPVMPPLHQDGPVASRMAV